MNSFGLALGGGGIAGCAHIGVLYALEEEGIPIHYLSGASCGAIIAALYAYGYSAAEIMDMAKTMTKHYLDYDYKSIIKRLFKRKAKLEGFLKGDKIHRWIAEKTDHADMSELKLPVVLSATDLQQARQVLFVSQPVSHSKDEADIIHTCKVADAVRASFSVPILFQPMKIGDRVLVDGGLMDNCPVSACRLLGAEKVVAVDLVFADPVQDSFDSIGAIVSRVARINVAMKSHLSQGAADLVLRPEAVSSIDVLDFSKINICMEFGYEYTRKQMEQIKKYIQ